MTVCSPVASSGGDCVPEMGDINDMCGFDDLVLGKVSESPILMVMSQVSTWSNCTGLCINVWQRICSILGLYVPSERASDCLLLSQ